MALQGAPLPAVPRHRQPIINAALTLFRRQGFARTGLNDIVDVSGAPKGSLYHYFPLGKSSIAAAAVEEAGRRVVATLEKLASECGSTGELLRAHARLLAGWMRNSGFRNGCPITTVLLELAPSERAVTDAGRKAYAARITILSRKLVEDGFAKTRADALAVLCTSSLQGALIQARVERSGRPIEVTAIELARLLEAGANRTCLEA
jgi:TetR/AcrR family transcriptional repressor of lmrAB and yxaGH operons